MSTTATIFVGAVKELPGRDLLLMETIYEVRDVHAAVHVLEANVPPRQPVLS